MKKFTFKLQTKLDIAEAQEKLAAEQLVLKITERNNIIDNLDLNINKLKDLENSVRHLPFKQTLVVKEYLPIVRNYIQELNHELIKAEERVEVARNILIECKKETKTLTKLKEKEWAEYLQELNIEEQKEIDEIAINNHFRNN